MTRRQHLEILLTRVERELANELARERRLAAARAEVAKRVPVDEAVDEPEQPARLRGPKPIGGSWTEDEARIAHAMHAAGNRDPWVIEAERQYQRDRKRESRARLRESA